MAKRLMLRDTFMELFKWPVSMRRILGEGDMSALDLGGGMIPVDIFEDRGELVVRASLPGYREEEIEVHVRDGLLSIMAEHSEEEGEEGKRYYQRERRVSGVSRRLALPCLVAEGEVRTELVDGVLILRIPKQGEAEA